MKDSRVQTLILLLISVYLPACNVYGQKPDDETRKITLASVQSKTTTITQQYTCRINSTSRSVPWGTSIFRRFSSRKASQ